MAGVAKSTVSRYLNGGSVSKEKREKIDKAIEETKYVPNNFAQSLKAKKNNLIGIIIPRLDSYATSRTLSGIDEVLRESGYQIIINCTYQSKEREIESMENFFNQGIAGMILIIEDMTDEHRKILNKIKIPALLIGQDDEEICCMIHDDYKAGYEAALLLISKGHVNISYVEEDKEDVSSWKRRKNGFLGCLKEHGINNINILKINIKTNDNVEVLSSVSQILHNGSTAVLCSTDKIAIEILHTLQKNNIKVPEDISVMGIGDYQVSRLIMPELTTVHYSYKSFGKIAAEKIINLVSGKSGCKKTVIPTKIILRETVDKIKE